VCCRLLLRWWQDCKLCFSPEDARRCLFACVFHACSERGWVASCCAKSTYPAALSPIQSNESVLLISPLFHSLRASTCRNFALKRGPGLAVHVAIALASYVARCVGARAARPAMSCVSKNDCPSPARCALASAVGELVLRYPCGEVLASVHAYVSSRGLEDVWTWTRIIKRERARMFSTMSQNIGVFIQIMIHELRQEDWSNVRWWK
jgi:hypothetical protein